MTFYPNQANNSPGRVRAQKIETSALFLREQGFDYDEIAERLSKEFGIQISREKAATAVRRGMAKYKKEARESASSIFDLELKRLDTLYCIAMAKVRGGDTDAIALCLRIMERRTKYLGLDAPVKQEVRTQETTAIDLTKLSLEELDQLERTIGQAIESGDSDDSDGDIDYED